MADNLDLDVYYYRNSLSTSNTHIASSIATNTLTSFKSGNRSAGNQYATAGINSSNAASYTDPSPSSHTTQDWTTSYSYSVPLANRHGKCDPNINGSYQCLSPYQNANYTHYGTTINKYGTPASDSSGTANITYNFGPGGYRIGTYYNYCAATLGSYCYGSGTSAGTSATGNATNADICPASWKLPVGGASGDFQNLYNKISNITTTPNGATDLLSLQTMLSTPVSGTYYSGTACRQGTYGYFWSSTYNSATHMYSMLVSGTAVSPQNSNARGGGSSVRCIAQN